jgi:hypothetical protein
LYGGRPFYNRGNPAKLASFAETGVFNAPSTLFAPGDPSLKAKEVSEKYRKNRLAHENPFRAGPGKPKPETFHATLAPYPEYMEPPPARKRKSLQPLRTDRMRNAATIMEERAPFR